MISPMTVCIRLQGGCSLMMDKMCCMQGYNAAIIAYGQTGTGKTFTMEGGPDTVSQGIIPRAIEDMFSSIEHDCAPRSKYLVRASYLQIYNEVGICHTRSCSSGTCFAST